jgi:pyruvate kinase
MERKARIVATLGPSCKDEATLAALIDAGLDVARLNFSHGTHEEHAERIAMIRQLSQEKNKPVSILQDLQGPKLRVGNLPEQGIKLVFGQKVKLASVETSDGGVGAGDGSSTFIPMDVPDLAGALSVGNRILLDDGHMELKVTGISTNEIDADVVTGGLLTSHKGVNLPGSKLNIPGFTEKDKADLQFGLEQGIDLVAISFVRSAQDILTVRQAIRTYAPDQADTPIVAKLERPEAIDNLEEILHVTDGVMVARGDLGVETSPAFVPIVQKRIIQEANRHSKIVITATQMLDSMIINPRPTRAEASDVANAVFDGTDAVMLSGETASGKYPVESVKMMDAIVLAAEEHFAEWGLHETPPEEQQRDDAFSITRAARELAHDRNVAAIAVFTQTGRTALLMSKARPRVPILAFTPEPRTYQRLNMLWGVLPFFVPYASTVEGMISHLEAAIVATTQIQSGQQVVVITGFPVGARIPPNFALLHTLGG